MSFVYYDVKMLEILFVVELMEEINMCKKNRIYGNVLGYENISFVLEDFQCVFFQTDKKGKASEVINPINNFIIGKTINGKYVYMHYPYDLKIGGKCTLNAWLYFLAPISNLTSFNSLRFEGGILNKLFHKNSLIINPDNRCMPKVEFSNDHKDYLLTNPIVKGTLTIGSGVQNSFSVEDGQSIQNTGTRLIISFEGQKDIKEISDIYGYILNMCSFMAFRRNINFDKINMQIDDEIIVSCYIKDDYNQNTQKSIYNCITFDDIGECVDNLLDSIVKNTPNKPQFSLGFIPESDEDVDYVTRMKIREVFSSLESELEIKKVVTKNEDAFQEIIEKLKQVVKDHRINQRGILDDKSYDYIFGTLNHMVGSLSDRIKTCLYKYQSLLEQDISEDEIDRLVKYRNTITHGSYMMLDKRLADTTFLMMELVYCCILERIGIADDTIKELINKRILS